MRVRCDVFLGEDSYLDLSFLKSRKKWLSKTDIYLEFILRGVYDKKVDFNLESDSDAIVVSRYSWNRFFLNIQDSGKVNFSVSQDGVVQCKEQIYFDVVEINVPLLFSIPSLLQYSVSDIRFFTNRISENLVNATRFNLFTPSILKVLAQNDFKLEDGIWKLYEIIFSILTERGITIVLTLFDLGTIYTLELVKGLRGLLFDFIRRSMKYNVIWDVSVGLGKRELGALIDSLVGTFGNQISLVVPVGAKKKVGGEGFAYSIKAYKKAEEIPLNERGIKIARIDNCCDYYSLRKFVQGAVQMNHGVEYIMETRERSLRRVKYSVSRALYSGYADAVCGKEER